MLDLWSLIKYFPFLHSRLFLWLQYYPHLCFKYGWKCLSPNFSWFCNKISEQFLLQLLSGSRIRLLKCKCSMYLENQGIFRVIWEAWQSIFRIDIRHRFLHSNIVRICACHLLVRCTPWQWPGPLFPPPDAKNRWQCEARDLDTQCRHCCRKLLLCNSHWCSQNPALQGTRITGFGCDQLQTKERENFNKLLFRIKLGIVVLFPVLLSILVSTRMTGFFCDQNRWKRKS